MPILGTPHKRYALKTLSQSREELGQIGGSGDMEADINLCAMQTIEPLFRKYLPREGQILEAGSGRGRWVFYLRRLGFDVTGLELARSEVDAAKAFDPKAPIEYGNVLHTPFKDHSIAAVISLGVMEHFEEGPAAALGEVRRILKPGGLLLVTVPTKDLVRLVLFHNIKSLQNSLRRLKGIPLEFEEYRYSRRQFASRLVNAGFDILDRAPDDFRPPLNMGLYTDSRFLRHPTRQWELNGTGNALHAALSSLSPWLDCSGTLWVCRVR